MSYIDGIKTYASQFANGESKRDFMPGEAAIPWGYEFMGVDKSQTAPERYGNYLANSNPVYSVVTDRAAMLASLPLRLYEFAEQTSSFNTPRSPEATLLQIKKKLDKLEDRDVSNPFMMNMIGALMHSKSGLDLKAHERRMGLAEVSKGSVFELLRHVNPFWTPIRLWRMTSMALDIWGEAYWFIERGENGKGKPQEIWWAKPTRVRPIIDAKKYIIGYWYMPVNGGEWELFEPSEVVQILNPNPNDQFQPLSPITPSQVYADHENTSMQSNMNLHKQGLNPGAVITPVKNKIWTEDQARTIESGINTRMGGFDKAHRWMVFRQEIQKHDTSVTPKDSEFVNGMEYDINRIANAYHWPVDLLGGKRTYENIDQALKQAWQTVTIQAAFIAAEISEFLFPMFSNPGVDVAFFDHTNVSVLQESETVRWERERTQVNRVIMVNEWRSERGLEPVEGGDRLFVSNQDTPLDDPLFVTGPETQGGDKKEDEEPVFSTNGSG